MTADMIVLTLHGKTFPEGKKKDKRLGSRLGELKPARAFDSRCEDGRTDALYFGGRGFDDLGY
jgi:hypothetical protein